ncbi:MAG: copper resistance protein NlpE N-terminal domain-containing protein [Xanthomarina gelatinilytica]|uniref:copper resistance protein NlpE N-terminal domain-containing protein n=1 Tax=Xanthomarina gelatinilytica TaxID=1137281 RepID=UPI003A87924C
MKFRLLELTALALILFTSCNNNEKKNPETPSENHLEEEMVIDSPTSESSLDWEGTYKGTLPCADCEGIERTITIKKDQTFIAKDNYLGKKDGVFDSRGYIKWLDHGQKIQLSDNNGTMYFVGKNTLTQLDRSGNKVTGELADFYVLKKQNNSNDNEIAFTGTKWKLVKLMGKDITNSTAFISFATEENRVFGHAGCNTFNGTYTIENNTQLKLSKIATTMKACPDMTLEDQFKEVLNKADNFSLNGNTMTLNKAKMAPLAVFEAVE